MEWLLGKITANAEIFLKAPFAFALVLVFGWCAGYVVATWYFSGRLASQEGRMASSEQQIARYRVALGIDQASPGALVTLTNIELKAKTATTVAKLRTLMESFQRRDSRLPVPTQYQPQNGLPPQVALLRELGLEFQRSYRADAVNLDNELRRRLGPTALAQIVGVPPTFYTDGAALGLPGVLAGGPPEMQAGLIGVLVDGMSQMAALLPDDDIPRVPPSQ